MGSEGRKDIMSSWSDLPAGILGMIMKHLSPVCQIHVRAVCKDWWVSSSVPSFPKLPWLMTHDWAWSRSGNIMSANKFHIPSLGETRLSMHELDGEVGEDMYGSCICASKFGWLLLQKSKKSFVYNPFTKEILRLPNLDISFNRITFSSVPKSEDCLFFAIQSSKRRNNKIKISMCSLGDQKWTSQTFKGIGRVIEDVVYSNGTFYCVFSGGVLGAYYVALNDWSVLTGMNPLADIIFRHRAQMVEANGEILLVCSSRILHIFKFDLAQMTWISINSLENHFLFLGCTSFAIAVSEETSNLAGRIYYHGNSGTRFHCLTDHSCNQCFELYPWDTRYDVEKIWIEHPQT